jgi:hypothetical protein
MAKTIRKNAVLMGAWENSTAGPIADSTTRKCGGFQKA